MSPLAAAFADGSVPALIAALVALEGVALWFLWRTRGIGIAPRALIGSLLSGACLMLAVRAALIDAPWEHLAAWLLLSLVAHLADLALRWSQRP
ncbi:MAG: hypothetical protein FJ179_11160 [Gammaproteobacteria bacterium]|nr:hypothetical protein [Gammaproteobacteria bacterium]